jgi:hypothetical protein
VKRKRFSVEQIVAVLKQAELGMAVADIIRQVGISEQNVLSLEEAVCRPTIGPGARVQAAPGRECAIEEARR